MIILKGGRTRQGRLAAASHTGALAGDDRAWERCRDNCRSRCRNRRGISRHAYGAAIPDAAAGTSRPTVVTLFGNGGGSSVLGSDAFARVGLNVLPFDAGDAQRLEALQLPPGTSVANPIDTPVRSLQEKDGWVAGEIFDIVYEMAKPDAVAMHLNLAAFAGRGGKDPLDNLLAVIEHTQKKWQGMAHFALALRSDGSPALDDKKRQYRPKPTRSAFRYLTKSRKWRARWRLSATSSDDCLPRAD